MMKSNARNSTLLNLSKTEAKGLLNDLCLDCFTEYDIDLYIFCVRNCLNCNNN